MTKLYTAFTKEIDDAEAAVRDVFEQLDPAKNALKNTIGIMHFYYEFVDTGVCRAIIDALPFELAGCVSSYTASDKAYGDIAMAITMITSDDVEFSVRTIEDVSIKSRDVLSDEVAQLCNDLCANEIPKMVMPFIPPLQHYGGDDFVSAVNMLKEQFPVFGTISFNTEGVSGQNYVVGNGNVASSFAFVAMYGNIETVFSVTTAFAFDDSFGGVAEITESEGHVLKKINGMGALSYLKEQGIVTSDNLVSGSAVWAVPAVLTYPNGTKIVRAFLEIVEGTEHIVSSGKMEIGTKIKFAFLDGDKTLASAEKLLDELNETKRNGIIAYSCAARAWSLGAKFFAEAQRIAECSEKYLSNHGESLIYSVAYSGGEICPVTDSNGRLVNALHNYTLVACSFY